MSFVKQCIVLTLPPSYHTIAWFLDKTLQSKIRLLAADLTLATERPIFTDSPSWILRSWKSWEFGRGVNIATAITFFSSLHFISVSIQPFYINLEQQGFNKYNFTVGKNGARFARRERFCIRQIAIFRKASTFSTVLKMTHRLNTGISQIHVLSRSKLRGHGYEANMVWCIRWTNRSKWFESCTNFLPSTRLQQLLTRNIWICRLHILWLTQARWFSYRPLISCS